MILEEILSSWRADCNIDRTELGEEALKIPSLHSKYYNIYCVERLALRKLEQDRKALQRTKTEYFNGTLSQEDLRDEGWDPFPMKLLKADVPLYIDADKDVISLNLKIAYAKEKVELLDSIIKTLVGRGFNIKAAIDWTKFTNGVI
tara:strand:- start:733 stop:1170 length:438 start_codon:yes stop_codon:yes gene_type:complete